MSTSKEKKKYVSNLKFLIHLQAEQQRSIYSNTEEKQKKKN